MAHEEVAVLKKWMKWVPFLVCTQTACPSDSFSFSALLCDLGRCLDPLANAPGKGKALVSDVPLIHTVVFFAVTNFAMICFAMGARTRHRCMLTIIPSPPTGLWQQITPAAEIQHLFSVSCKSSSWGCDGADGEGVEEHFFHELRDLNVASGNTLVTCLHTSPREQDRYPAAYPTPGQEPM